MIRREKLEDSLKGGRDFTKMGDFVRNLVYPGNGGGVLLGGSGHKYTRNSWLPPLLYLVPALFLTLFGGRKWRLVLTFYKISVSIL